MPETKTYRGQCHCGAVQFQVTTDLSGTGACNCSRCRRLGWVMQSVPASDFVLESGEANLSVYHFSSETIDHLFCRTCGIESFARGADGKGNETVVVNLNCLEPSVAVEPATVTHWDGANY